MMILVEVNEFEKKILDRRKSFVLRGCLQITSRFYGGGVEEFVTVQTQQFFFY